MENSITKNLNSSELYLEIKKLITNNKKRKIIQSLGRKNIKHLISENNVIISGTLTAQTYIVSESVTSVSSGSTAFGDSTDDTHIFKGAITASGNISSSGAIIALSSNITTINGGSF